MLRHGTPFAYRAEIKFRRSIVQVGIPSALQVVMPSESGLAITVFVFQEIVMAKKASSGGTRIVPLGDRVVLKRAEAEETTAGGIVLPDSAKGKPQRGEVIAVGDGHVNDKGERVPLTVKEGDKVIFSSYAGDEISVGDEDYLLLRESDILATL